MCHFISFWGEEGKALYVLEVLLELWLFFTDYLQGEVYLQWERFACSWFFFWQIYSERHMILWQRWLLWRIFYSWEIHCLSKMEVLFLETSNKDNNDDNIHLAVEKLVNDIEEKRKKFGFEQDLNSEKTRVSLNKEKKSKKKNFWYSCCWTNSLYLRIFLINCP